MDRGAWGATVHGGHKESDMTERGESGLVSKGMNRLRSPLESRRVSLGAHAARTLGVPLEGTRRVGGLLGKGKINPEYSLEGLMLKLKLQFFGHLMRRVDSLEKTLMLGGIGGKRRRPWNCPLLDPRRVESSLL